MMNYKVSGQNSVEIQSKDLGTIYECFKANYYSAQSEQKSDGVKM